MSVRIGYLADLRNGAALSSLDGQPLVFNSKLNFRLRISAFAPNAASGNFQLEVTHGISGVANLFSPSQSYTTAAGFNANSTLYDALASFIGVTANNGAGSSVTVTDAGFDQTGPFVDVQVIATTTPTVALTIASGGNATITAALDATAICGWTGRTATALVLAGVIRPTRVYDRNGNLLGLDLEAHLSPGGIAGLQNATTVAGVIDPGAAIRVPSYRLRVNATEMLIVREPNGGFSATVPGDVAPATTIP